GGQLDGKRGQGRQRSGQFAREFFVGESMQDKDNAAGHCYPNKTRMRRPDLVELFTMRRTSWKTGVAVIPANWAAQTMERALFLQHLSKSSRADAARPQGRPPGVCGAPILGDLAHPIRARP